MKNFVNKVLHHAGQLDSVIDAFVSDKLRGDRLLTPAELLEGIVADVERRITIGPRGPLFPANRIAVVLAAANTARQTELRAALSPEEVRKTVVARLQRQVTVAEDLRVDVRVSIAPETAAAFTVMLRTVAGKRLVAPPVAPSVARLVKGDGSARFTLGEGVSNIGRVAEIHGRDGKMVRRNQIVLDGDAASATVSRMHARIQGTREHGVLTFTVFDEGSQRGSTVVRGGRAHKVLHGALGFRLKDGDEVHFGKVRLQFRMRAGSRD